MNRHQTLTSILRRAGFLAALFLLLAAATARAADDPNKLVIDAEEAYRQGKYEESARVYEKLVELAPHDPAVLYNLGTAYARVNQRGLAIWRYLQAERLMPRERTIKENLRILAPEIDQQLAISPLPPIDWVYNYLTANEWGRLAAGALVLVCLLGALYFWLPRENPRRQWVMKGVWLAGLLAAASWPFALMHFFRAEVWQGVVVAEGTVARTGPSESQIENFALPAGTVVRIMESTTQEWVKISFAGGRVGFIKKEQVRFL